jgi:phosphoglycolate phosphatase
MGIPKKPAPLAVYSIIEQCGSAAAETVYIGDSEVDVATAKNAGVACVAVTWGFRERETLEACGATVFADTPEEVKRLILA